MAIKYLEKGGYKGVLPSKRTKTGSGHGGAMHGGKMPGDMGDTSYNPDSLLDK
jgi:hypothetical protein